MPSSHTIYYTMPHGEPFSFIYDRDPIPISTEALERYQCDYNMEMVPRDFFLRLGSANSRKKVINALGLNPNDKNIELVWQTPGVCKLAIVSIKVKDQIRWVCLKEESNGRLKQFYERWIPAELTIEIEAIAYMIGLRKPIANKTSPKTIVEPKKEYYDSFRFQAVQC